MGEGPLQASGCPFLSPLPVFSLVFRNCLLVSAHWGPKGLELEHFLQSGDGGMKPSESRSPGVWSPLAGTFHVPSATCTS
jgi:hypothetical protein